jgi:protein gp37
MGKSKIEWTEKTWNPITGCTKISEGCQNCYAERMAKRLAGRFGYPADDPFKPGTFHRQKIDEPLKWKKPCRIFVGSMGDMFHHDVHHVDMKDIQAVIKESPQHTYIFLTKRPDIMLRYTDVLPDGWPSNCWLGVTAENQQRADERIPILLQIPAAVRFVSVEPMLEFMDLSYWLNGAPEQFAPARWRQTYPPLDWVIAGPETGTGARKANNEWFRDLRRQCFFARVPYFLKKTADGGRLLEGREWNEYPEVKM